jgi:hypothetical protein
MPDIYTPGSIRAADEAFDGLPAEVPPDFILLPPLKSIANVADQAFPPPPGGSQKIPTPIEVAVASLTSILPSLSLGTPLPQAPTTNVATQNNTFQPAQEWVVTENGNFQTNNNVGDVTLFTINTVTPFGTGVNQVFQITLLQNGKTAVLSNFGVDFTELFASFPAAALPQSPENVPSRPITFFNDPGTIVILAQDSFGNTLTTPAPGDKLTIGILRQGPSDVVLTNFKEIDVTIAPPPPVALTTPAQGLVSLGNVGATDGVVKPFVGTGQGAPPFIGTFEVENQALIGKGLPANVFV